tara:strand:- start:261 stop:521 length:261 start_codon:yes stop_codon:yes gene_type:complete
MDEIGPRSGVSCMIDRHPNYIQITYDEGYYWLYYCDEDGTPRWKSELGGECLGLETAQEVLNLLPKLMLKLEVEDFVELAEYTKED